VPTSGRRAKLPAGHRRPLGKDVLSLSVAAPTCGGLFSIDDDANALYRRMVVADLVLIAAPVFCWGFRPRSRA
jgi:hypothetical protein